ncbi:MAG: hypothetical protein HYZ28_14200 [Myxococcales bacterium]|nr:hypothetical protein [Myxococcales bacterium]
MAIRDESTSSAELRKDGVFHRAGVNASSKTKHLAPPVKSQCDDLKGKWLATQDAVEEELVAQANLAQAEVEAQDEVRVMELDLLRRTGKRREEPQYKGLFPKGLVAALEPRGKEQADELNALAKRLDAHAPALWKQYGKSLKQLAQKLLDDNAQKEAAEQEVAQAEIAERLSRAALVKVMQKNEGSLLTLFPGDKRKVRSFFRPVKKSPKKPSPGNEGGNR